MDYHPILVLLGVFACKAIYALIEGVSTPQVSSAQSERQIESSVQPSVRSSQFSANEERDEELEDKIRKLHAHEKSARAIGSAHEADAFAAKIRELRRKV